jgi:asparagine synthase (glutamine-hydrolysing)
MCGIAGYVGEIGGHETISPPDVLDSISHRGPDGKKSFTVRGGGGSAFFGHSRLSIIDTSSAGAQPMVVGDSPSEPGITITFNGEIYNYRQIKEELSGLGFQFSGGSDTEVILQAYRAWGVNSFSRLRGMFAFALADPGRDTVFLARDHLGIKPLYLLTPSQGGLSFASEVRAFRFLPGSEKARRICRDALHGFFAQGMVLGERSFVEGVEELGPGQFLALDFTGRQKFRNTFTGPGENGPAAAWKDRPRAIGCIRQALGVSVGRHLIADVPVGIFLSAGIDSTALATIASESHADLRTVSIGFDQRESDESEEAACIAAQLGIHNEVVTLRAQSILADLDSVFAAMDQPTVDGFNTYFVSRAARQAGLKVALSGLGADEIFGGYASFYDVPKARMISWLARIARIGKLISATGRLFGSRSLWKAGRTGVYPSSLTGMYFLRRELFSTEDRFELMGNPSEAIDSVTGAPVDFFETLVNQVSTLDSENSVAFLEQQVYMRSMLLRDSDVFSMVNGVEIRVPFLDQDLLSLVNPMPGIWKRPRPNPKALLVDAVGSRFPCRVLGRKKRGFTFPWNVWFRGPMREFARERLDSTIWKKLQIPKTVVDKIWLRFEGKDPSVTALHVLALVSLADLVERQQLSL